MAVWLHTLWENHLHMKFVPDRNHKSSANSHCSWWGYCLASDLDAEYWQNGYTSAPWEADTKGTGTDIRPVLLFSAHREGLCPWAHLQCKHHGNPLLKQEQQYPWLELCCHDLCAWGVESLWEYALLMCCSGKHWLSSWWLLSPQFRNWWRHRHHHMHLDQQGRWECICCKPQTHPLAHGTLWGCNLLRFLAATPCVCVYLSAGCQSCKSWPRSPTCLICYR